MDSEHEIAERPTPQLRDLSEPYSAGGVFVVVMAILGLLGAWGVRAISRRMLWLDEIDAMARAEVEQAPQPQPKAAWEDSTDDERRVLAQASFEGFLNPQRQNEDIVFRLVTRGLVDAKTLRVNPDMVNFVRRRISDTDLEKWEGEEGPSLWASIRAPLSTAIAALIAAGAAEPVLGGGGSGSGGLPMAAVGIPTLLHIVASVLTKKKPEA